MKWIVVLLVFIMVGCTNNAVKKSEEILGALDSINQELDSANTESEKPTPTTLKQAFKSNASLSVIFHDSLGLDTDRGAFRPGMQCATINDVDVYTLLRSFDATPTIVAGELVIVAMAGGAVLDTLHRPSFNWEVDPEITLLYDEYVMIRREINEWRENNDGIMEQTGQGEEHILICSIKNGKLIQPKDMDERELRIARNFPFAWHGYQFKSPNMSDYFSRYDWYEPQYPVVDSRLTEQDKQFIAAIKALE